MITVPPQSLLSLLVLVLGSVAPGAVAQDAFPFHEPEHLATVQRERERELLRCWVAATEEARTEAAETLSRGRNPMGPERMRISVRALSVAVRKLSGSAPEPSLYRYQELADAIDLRVVPGAFESRTEGLGEPITVHVTTLFEVTPPVGSVETILFWIGEDGREERARGEEIPGSAFVEGFEMYVRPPISGPGRWRLVAELRAESGVVRSPAVPVDCVVDLRERVERLGDSSPPFAAGLVARARSLLAFGARSSDAVPLDVLLDLAEGKGARSPLRPVDLGGTLRRVAELWEIVPPEGSKPAEVVLLLAERGEHPTDLLGEPLLGTWQRSRDAAKRRVLAVSLSPGLGPEAEEALRSVVEVLRERAGAETLILAVRGEGALLAPVLLREPRGPGDEARWGLGVDALVMSESTAAHHPPRLSLPIPVLQLAEDAPELAIEEGVNEAGCPWRRVSLPVPRVVSPLELPRRLDEWRQAE